MKIDNNTLATMKENCLIVWQRLTVIYPEIKDKLNEQNTSDLWFRAWTSIAYDASNPNVIKDENGKRLLPYNPDFELYPCNSDDNTMKAAYKRIYRHITEAK